MINIFRYLKKGILLITIITLGVISFYCYLRSNNNLEGQVPEYITIEDVVFENTDLFTCSSSAYKIKVNEYSKNIATNIIWKNTPISKVILSGTSLKTRALFLGASCGGGLGSLQGVFNNLLDSSKSKYTYLDGDDIFLLVNPQSSLLFIFSVD